MKFYLVVITLSLLPFGCANAVPLEFFDIPVEGGLTIQGCARYPDRNLFQNAGAAVFFIQGSGPDNVCAQLRGAWVEDLTSKGIALFANQKRGIRDSKNGTLVTIEKTQYLRNTLQTLKADSIKTFEFFSADSRIDPTRIGIVGGSEGSILAVEVAINHPETRAITLVSSVIEKLSNAISRQYFKLLPAYLLEALDSNKNRKLEGHEFNSDFTMKYGLPSFQETDLDGDNEVTAQELSISIRRTVKRALSTGDNTFFYSDLGGNVSAAWVQSAFSETGLGPRILRLSIPVELHHGVKDTNVLVGPVRTLQKIATTESKSNISFSYYEGLDHGLNKPTLLRIISDLANKL